MFFYVSSVFAQGSMTLYGVLENGFDYVNNSGGKQVYAMRDGTYTGVYGSRWGICGQEDLGGGWSALTRLENGFNIPTGNLGQGGRMFGRQAYLGLSNNNIGVVTAGRQYDSMVDYLQFATTGSVLGSYASHASDIDNLSNSYRIDNSVKFTSALANGIRFGGLVALADSATSTSQKQVPVWSAGADYTGHGLRAGLAYFHADNPASLFSDGAHYLDNTSGSAIGSTGPWSYVGRPSKVDSFGLGATYTVGKSTFAAVLTRARFADANGTKGNATFDDADVSFRYAVTPAVKVIGGYLYTIGHINYAGYSVKYHRVALGTDYALSKRTDIYFGLFAQQAGGAAKGADLYQGAGTQTSTTDRQFAMRTALVTRF
ncbi:porin [Paraburkholderia acidiphila]|uniref:Porin n=1 Tax=Paraburkholderia acidiphila TaxID=2571747 RepID=A0A7Z2G797_9BURK|nr:porin [Paraburkholderia acidiphila]QGZ56381.1 porin [Paraburkholderia acidiphila]